MNKKTSKPIKANQTSTERLIESTLLRAKAIKATAEESMKKELLESFSPMMKKTISNHLSEMDDFEMEDTEDEELSEESEVEEVEEMEDFEDINEEETEEVETEEAVEEAPVETEEVSDEEVMEEGQSDEDSEFLAELERLLSEGDEVEYEEETEELTESEETDDLNESEETDEEEQLDESEETDEEETEELSESEVSKELDNSFRGAMTEAKRKKVVKESKDGGTYTGKGGKADPYSGKATDKNDVYTLKAENKRLKEALSKINNQLSETDMDSKRLREMTRLSKQYKLTEAMKLKVMRNVDSAKNERELKLVVESMENTFRKSSSYKGTRLKEGQTKRTSAGKSSSVKPMLRKKSLNEGAGRIIDTDLVSHWSHLAGLDDK